MGNITNVIFNIVGFQLVLANVNKSLSVHAFAYLPGLTANATLERSEQLRFHKAQ